MSNALLTKLRAERDDAVSGIEALMAAEGFDPADKTFVEARSAAEALDSKIAAITDFEQKRSAANKIDSIGLRHGQVEQQSQTREAGTPGVVFTRSRAYDDFKAAPRGTSGHVHIDLDNMLQTRAPVLTNTFPGVLEANRIAPTPLPTLQTPLLSVINRIPVTSNSVEWVFYPVDAPLGTVTPEGQNKTEVAVQPVLKTVTLETIASHLTVSRQTMEDGGALMTYIDSALRRGIVDRMEAQAADVLADTVANGIPETPNPNDAGTGDAPLIAGIRRAVATVQTAGFGGGNILAVVNPMDFAALDITLLGSTLLGPAVTGTYWGTRIVPSPAVPSGTAFVGDFSVGMALLTRSDVNMYLSTSHDRYMVQNLILLLAEARGKAIVHRPEALTYVQGSVDIGALSAAPAAAKK